MPKIKVAVLMGGESNERLVSLLSGKTVVDSLDREKYEIISVDVPFELEKIESFKPDIAMITLHGKGGEDGQIQGYLETVGLKYTGSGMLASAIGINKTIFRRLMEVENILMPKLTDKVPCVVKPVDGGSSIGVSIVLNQKDLEMAIKKAKQYSSEVVVEEYIEGREFSCGILGNQVLPVIEIKPKNQFFDYEAKYNEGKALEICPANISEEMTSQIQEIALKVFQIIGGRGCARVDMMMKDDKVYVLEVNTLPGMTQNSLLPQEAQTAGISYPELLDKMIELGLE